jgi:hypothetical protein
MGTPHVVEIVVLAAQADAEATLSTNGPLNWNKARSRSSVLSELNPVCSIGNIANFISSDINSDDHTIVYQTMNTKCSNVKLNAVISTLNNAMLHGLDDAIVVNMSRSGREGCHVIELLLRKGMPAAFIEVIFEKTPHPKLFSDLTLN